MNQSNRLEANDINATGQSAVIETGGYGNDDDDDVLNQTRTIVDSDTNKQVNFADVDIDQTARNRSELRALWEG